MSQTVIVMRHAERADDAKGYTGPQLPDPPITPEGEKGSVAAAKAIAVHYRVTLVVASPFLRCVQTATTASAHLGGTPRIVYDNGLHEVNNLTKIKSDTAVALTPSVGASDGNPNPPRWGEDIQDATKRFSAAVTRIAKAYPQHKVICLVTHGDAVSGLARQGLLGVAPAGTVADDVMVYNCDYNGWAAVVVAAGEPLRMGRAAGVAWMGIDVPEGGVVAPPPVEVERTAPPVQSRIEVEARARAPPAIQAARIDEASRLIVRSVDSPKTQISCWDSCVLQ